PSQYTRTQPLRHDEMLPDRLLSNHGRSSKRAARISSRTSAATELRRPFSEKSLSIWQSQAALSHSRMKTASSVSSSGERASTTVFVLARLTAGVCRMRGESAMSPKGSEAKLRSPTCRSQVQLRNEGMQRRML